MDTQRWKHGWVPGPRSRERRAGPRSRAINKPHARVRIASSGKYTHTGRRAAPGGRGEAGCPAPYTSAATAASTAATASDTPFALPGSGAAVVLPLVGVAVVGAAVVEPGYTMFSCVQTDV